MDRINASRCGAMGALAPCQALLPPPKAFSFGLLSTPHHAVFVRVCLPFRFNSPQSTAPRLAAPRRDFRKGEPLAATAPRQHHQPLERCTATQSNCPVAKTHARGSLSMASADDNALSLRKGEQTAPHDLIPLPSRALAGQPLPHLPTRSSGALRHAEACDFHRTISEVQRG